VSGRIRNLEPAQLCITASFHNCKTISQALEACQILQVNLLQSRLPKMTCAVLCCVMSYHTMQSLAMSLAIGFLSCINMMQFCSYLRTTG